MRLTAKDVVNYLIDKLHKKEEEYKDTDKDYYSEYKAKNLDEYRYVKLGQLENIEEKFGIGLIEFLTGIDPDTCFMEITEDKKFYLCGDAYYGNYSKEELLQLIQELLFMYWTLTKGEENE